MGGRVFGAHRIVLPIGQDVNRDEVDAFRDARMAQPEFPDIGVT